MQISTEFNDWGLAKLKSQFENGLATREKIQKQLTSSLEILEKKFANLTDALISELIDEEEFKISKKCLTIKIKELEGKLSKIKKSKVQSSRKIEKIFDFVVRARNNFNN